MITVEEQVKIIISEQLFIKTKDITAESRIMDDLGADSLDVVELFVLLEFKFNIRISEQESRKISTVGDVVLYIEETTKPA